MLLAIWLSSFMKWLEKILPIFYRAVCYLYSFFMVIFFYFFVVLKCTLHKIYTLNLLEVQWH